MKTPTSACFRHMSRFLRWALEKWSHAFCLEAAWNTDTICSTVAGDAGASMGVQRKKEREGRLGSAEEWKNMCQVGRKWCCFPLPPSIQQHKHWAGVATWVRSEWDHISVSVSRLKGEFTQKWILLSSFLPHVVPNPHDLLSSVEHYIYCEERWGPRNKIFETWERVNEDTIFIFGWTIALTGLLLYVVKQQLEHSA